MKQRFLILLIILFAINCKAFSQCTVSIPAGTHIHNSSLEVITTGADNLKILGDNWVCGGDTLWINSGFGSQTFFLEKNAVLIGGGGGSRTVYLKAGAVFDAGGGGSQIIIYEPGATYFGMGGGNSITPCSAVIFDYTNAPPGGCNPVDTPSAEFISNYTAVCSGNSITFSDQSTGSPSMRNWTFPGGTPGSSTSTNPIITYDTTGVYDVKLVVTNASGKDSLIKTGYITVNALPVAGQVIGNPDTICYQSVTQLTVTGSYGVIQWQSSTNGILFKDISGASSKVYNDSNLTQTTYYRVKVFDSCGTDSSNIQVINVFPKFVGGTISTPYDTICQGASASLLLSGNSTNVIQWQLSVDDINFTDIAKATDTTKYTTLPLQQSAWFSAKVGNSRCDAHSDTLALYVPPPLTASFYSTQTGNNKLTFNSDSSSGNIKSYHWSFGDNQISMERNPTHTYTKDTTYYVCLTLYDGSDCSYTFCKYISVTADAIETVAPTGNWIAFPNPFSNELMINVKNLNVPVKNICIYDVLGRLIINRKTDGINNSTLRLDVSALAGGMYYMVVKTAEDSYMQRVVKQ